MEHQKQAQTHAMVTRSSTVTMIISLIWNARGVGKKPTVRRLKKLCKPFSYSAVLSR